MNDQLIARQATGQRPPILLASQGALNTTAPLGFRRSNTPSTCWRKRYLSVTVWTRAE